MPEFVVVPVVEVPEPCNDGCCDEPEQKLPEPCNDGCCDEPKQDQEPEDSCCGDCGGDEESERGRSVSASGSAIKLPECCDGSSLPLQLLILPSLLNQKSGMYQESRRY